MLLVALAALLLVLLIAPGAAPAAGFWWDALSAVGFCAIAAIAFLGWTSESPTTSERQRWHRNLGILAVVLGTIHAAGYLIGDRTVIEYLLPAAPGYMISGLVALVVLTGMTLTSLPRLRRLSYPGFAEFRRWHRGGFLILLGTGTWHVLGTDFSLNHTWQRVLVPALLVLLPLVAYGHRRRGGRVPAGSAPAGAAAADTHAVLTGLALLLLSALYATTKHLGCESC